MWEPKKKKVCVVVLGDIGRNPRMQYHGLSLAENGYDVEFIGYSGSKPIKKLIQNSSVKFRYIYDCPEFKNYLPTVLAYIFKFLWQAVTLLIGLLLASFPDYVLVQNPPALPTLGVCYIYCRIFRSKFVIDWHNYAYSILALSVGPDHSLVKISKWFEFCFGRKADKNLCVTKGMKEDLNKNHKINAVLFYDRAPDFFKKPTVAEKHRLFLSLGWEYDLFLKNCNSGETIFTKSQPKTGIVSRADRPGLIVTSTSWTLDEDISILLDALREYDKAKDKSDDLPNLICAITGKGPLKEFYVHAINRRVWNHIQFVTPWLEAENYPVFLGCADLGVCLHKSSSGLDLPMKIIDMFGCLVPVCATDYECLSELVKHKKNGFVFNDSKGLFLQIKEWFTGFPDTQTTLQLNIKKNLEMLQSVRWHDNWKYNVQPLF